MAILLDGNKVRDLKALELKKKVSGFSTKPKLVILQVGSREESNVYIGRKKKFGESIGCEVVHEQLPETISEASLITEIEKLNADKSVHGMIVQLPIPKEINCEKVIEAIDPAKDVDGLHPVNAKLLSENNKEGFVPATAKGILTLLQAYDIPIAGKKVTVIGRSLLVGKPTALLLLNQNATVTVCHSKTGDLVPYTKDADIIVVAVGVPNLIGARHTSPLQCVIDVGINIVQDQKGDSQKPEDEIPQKRMVGDVNFEEVKDIVGFISPVPGGVGPMTVLSLFENLVSAYEMQTGE